MSRSIFVFLAFTSIQRSARCSLVLGEATCGWIDLAPGAKIYLLKESGHVTAILTATDQPRAGMRWIQMDDNWSLQNLLAELFGRLRDPRG